MRAAGGARDLTPNPLPCEGRDPEARELPFWPGLGGGEVGGWAVETIPRWGTPASGGPAATKPACAGAEEAGGIAVSAGFSFAGGETGRPGSARARRRLSSFWREAARGR